LKPKEVDASRSRRYCVRFSLEGEGQALWLRNNNRFHSLALLFLMAGRGANLCEQNYQPMRGKATSTGFGRRVSGSRDTILSQPGKVFNLNL